jgi:hypothetical protein
VTYCRGDWLEASKRKACSEFLENSVENVIFQTILWILPKNAWTPCYASVSGTFHVMRLDCAIAT